MDVHERSHRQYPHDMVLAAVWEQGYLTALADLRAKVLDLPGRGLYVRGHSTVLVDRVLALLDEAQP